jgi:hypothetical protein
MAQQTLFESLSDDMLIQYEQYLYDAEQKGMGTWAERDQVLWEMNKRGLCNGSANHPSS